MQGNGRPGVTGLVWQGFGVSRRHRGGLFR